MSKRCVGCMKIKTQSPVCEHCGYNENIPNYAHQLPIGTVLHGQYTVGKVLGQGGFGITYIGWDNSLDAPVGIKEFYPNSIVTRECVLSLDVHCAGKEAEGLFYHNRERFLREAKILAKLQNVPGIVRVQNLFAENNTAYIVMEYVEGIDLKHYIRMRNRVLSPEEAFAVFRPMMYALSKVHEAELVHRDISPDNIMIQTDGTAKLLDFGAAREVENAEVDKELPRSTEAILKHGFAPMEQYQRRGTLGPWTDVYALCATMYYCLTGKVPADAPERIMGSDNVNWRQIPGLTEQQIQTLEKGLALLPENRIRTMKELHNGLFGQNTTGFTQIKKEEPKKEPEKKPEPKKKPEKKAEKKPDYPTHSVSLEEPAKPKKRKKPFGLIAAALAIVAAVGAFALKPREEVGTTAAPEEKPSVSATEPAVTLPLSEEEKQYLAAEELEKAGEYGKAAIAFGKLGDYADAWKRSSNLWAQIAQRETVVFACYYANDVAFGVKADGTMRTAETSNPGYLPPFDLSDWTDIVSIGGNGYAVVGLRSDGRVLCATRSEEYAIDTSTWTDVVAIYYCGTFVIGLKADGTLVTTGESDGVDLSKLSGWTDVVSLHRMDNRTHILGLKADGTVLLEGNKNYNHNLNVSAWSDIIEIKVSRNNVVGLKSDGTLVATGDNAYGQCDVSAWTDIIDFETSYGDGEIGAFTVGLKSDGTVVAAGCNRASWHLDSLAQWTDIQEISVGSTHILGLKADGTVVGGGREYLDCLDVSDWTDVIQVITNQYNTRALKADGTVLTIGNAVQGQCVNYDWHDIVKPIRMDYCFQSDGTVVTADNRYKNLIHGWTDMKLPMSQLPQPEVSEQETVVESSVEIDADLKAGITSGEPTGAEWYVTFSPSGQITVHSIKYQLLDNGYRRYTVEFTTKAGKEIVVFNPPNGSLYSYPMDGKTSGEKQTMVFDVKESDFIEARECTIKFFNNKVNDTGYIFLRP